VVVAKTMARPIHELTAAAQAIEHDEAFEPESIAGVAAQSDELGQLARVFRDMALAVQERERKLKNQVRQLRIQIDEEKRQRQVKEIVEDDFFQDLQAKAREMRGEQ
jgi:nitrate/nitrite-specific signal transduction histidine kinase